MFYSFILFLFRGLEPHIREQNAQQTAQLVLDPIADGCIMLVKACSTTLSAKLHLTTETKTARLVFTILHRQAVEVVLGISSENTLVHLLVAVHEPVTVKAGRHQEEAGVTPARTIRCAAYLFIQFEFLHVEHHLLVLSAAFHLADHLPDVEHRIAPRNLQKMRTLPQRLRPLHRQFYHQILIVSLAFAVVEAVVFLRFVANQIGGVN